ncbi:hypothetical protein ACFVWY_25685 [Streptomyces sp. NPDC058195]
MKWPRAGNQAGHFLRNNRQEGEEHRGEVTAFEPKNLLPVP